MENSTELCENVSVTASENTNNSEIESKTIDKDNKMSEEVTANLSEIKEKEVKALNTKKSFKWTNEATKAAACMLKDIIDEYNAANSDLSSSLDENTDPWGFYKLNEQMKVLKQSIELDLYPEEWCRFKLASLIKKYIDEHSKAIIKIRKKFEHYDSEEEGIHFTDYLFEYDLHYLNFALCNISKKNINYGLIAEGIIENNNFDIDSFDIFSFSPFYFDNFSHDMFNLLVKNSETNIVADYANCFFKDDEDENENEKYIDFEKVLSIPEDFRCFFLSDLLKKALNDQLPKIEDIDSIKGLKCNNYFGYYLTLKFAECSYVSIDFLNIADAFITDEINNLKGLKETYSSMFDE